MATKKDDFALLRDRIIVTVLFAYLVSLLFFVGYSLFTFPEKLFLHPFRGRWTMMQAAVYFISTLNPIQCTAILLACSFTAPPVPSVGHDTADTFSRLITITLSVLIFFCALFVGLSEGLLPSLKQSISELEDRTTIARNYLLLAGKARADGELEQSEAYLTFYLAVDADHPDALAMLSDVRKRMDNVRDDSPKEGPTGNPRFTELDPAELIERARSSLATEDYYSAYYFADLAKKLTPAGTPTVADSITATIQERLSSYQADAAELESKALFQMKTKGFNDLSSNDVELVTRAYYTFLMLTRNHPDDAEAENYLGQTVAKLKQLAYFLDEVDYLVAMPGLVDLFFVNSQPDDELVELVAIGRVIRAENGTFAKDIEIVSFAPDGTIRCRTSAETGKIMETPDGTLAIYMRGIDPVDRAGTRLPVYTEEADGAACGEIVSLRPDLGGLELVSRSGRNLDSYHLADLWGLGEIISPLGYPADVVQAAVLSRIVSIFGILVLSLLALAIGWRLRSPGGRPPIGGIILIPAFPLIAHFVIEVYEYIHQLIVGVSLAVWGFFPAMIILFAIEFVLLSVSILILASQAMTIRENR